MVIYAIGDVFDRPVRTEQSITGPCATLKVLKGLSHYSATVKLCAFETIVVVIGRRLGTLVACTITA